MSARTIILGLVAMILSAGPASTASGQVWQPFGPVDYRHDFAPFETFDIKNMSSAPDPHEGFYASYDKLSWAVQGERNLIGNPNVVDFVPDVLRGVQPPQVFNGLNDSSPEAVFGWGDRYEIGYVCDHHGWEASVLDGPEAVDVEEYGFVDEIFTDPNNGDTTIVLDPNPASGNVTILFGGDPNQFLGFLFLETGEPFDLDQDGTLDADDLISYMPTFDLVTVRNTTKLDGIDLMKTYRFKQTSHGSSVEFAYGARYLRIHDDFRVDAMGGPFNDLFFVNSAAAPVNDRTGFWYTTIDNHIVGPQVALKWSKRQGRFTYRANGRFLFGYNVQDHDQVGQVVTAHDYQGRLTTTVAPTPPVGAAGVFTGKEGPVLLPNTAFRHGKQEQDFSPLVEFRTEVNYHLTQDFALKLGFNATFIDNVRRASRQIDYTLPNMGFVNGGTQEIFVGGVNFGCEFNR
jgi:hypothetical protein